MPKIGERPNVIKDRNHLKFSHLVWILEDMTLQGIWLMGIEEKVLDNNDGKNRSWKIRPRL